MTQLSISSILAPYLERLKIHLSAGQNEQLNRLAAAMLADPLYKSVSKIFAPEEMALKHFLDSLAPLCFSLDIWKAKKIMDLGTGAGFPCLPLAVALPGSQIIAVDSRQKSVEFVARMAAAIGLSNVAIQHARIEDIGRDAKFREKSDLVVCRALSSVRTLVEYTMPLVKTGGHTFYYKGPKLEEEVKESTNAFAAFSIASENFQVLHLLPPDLPFERNFLVIQKTKAVPDSYPRKCGQAVEKPL